MEQCSMYMHLINECTNEQRNNQRDFLTIITQKELCVKILPMVCIFCIYPIGWCEPSHLWTHQPQGTKKKSAFIILEHSLRVEMRSMGPNAILHACCSRPVCPPSPAESCIFLSQRWPNCLWTLRRNKEEVRGSQSWIWEILIHSSLNKYLCLQEALK